METVELVPGDRSHVGRVTSRDLHRLRTQVYENDAAMSPKAQTLKSLGSAAASTLDANTLGLAASGPIPADVTQKLSVQVSAPEAGSNGGEDLDEGPGSRSMVRLLDDAPVQPAAEERPTIAFTGQGQETVRFCEMTRMLGGRFAFPAKLEQRPEVGKYDVKHGDKGLKITRTRSAEWDFSLRGRHPSRKPPDRTNEQDPFRAQDVFDGNLSSFHQAVASKSPANEVMRLTSGRRAIEKSQGRTMRDELLMHEANPHGMPWDAHDVFSSKRWREPDWDLKKVSGGHKVEVIKNYYEPGKFAVSLSGVRPGVKEGMHFSRLLSRSTSGGQVGHASGQLGHAAPKAVLQKEGREGNNKGSIQDRSLARDSPLARPRVVKVNDFEKELARPPLIRTGGEYYDEDDPDVMEATLKGQLAFDADSADRAVIPRRDHAPSMKSSLSRDRAGRGNRIFQSETGLRMSKGIGNRPAEVGLHISVEQSKESPSRPRPDVGTTFDQCKGRLEASPKTRTRHSSLRQPRDEAAPDFARSAPSLGFTTRAAVERPSVVQWTRAHEAIPSSWSVESTESLDGVATLRPS